MTKPPSEKPSNITILSQRRAKKASSKDDMFELLSRIDELEDALEILEEHGLSTKEELESLIGELERRAGELDGEE